MDPPGADFDAHYNENFGCVLIELDNNLVRFYGSTLTGASTRVCWAEVRTGNISLGVLPGGGDKAYSASGSFDILSCRLDGGSRVSFRQSSLLRLVDERDELRNDLLRRLLH